jgi:predicted metal-dependent phosphoesterase TrpH
MGHALCSMPSGQMAKRLRLTPWPNDQYLMDRIDLHTHSNCSDGSLSPRELVQLAKKRDLRAIALTDHDTVAGVVEAVAAGKELGVEVVPGVEISAQYPPGTMHILGYCLNPSQPELLTALKKLQEVRAARNPKIIARLQALGLEISTDEVFKLSSGQVGRPHIAKALVNRGYVSSIDEAFSRYLKKGAVAYVEKFRFSPRDAIALIRGAGGLAVLAHPFTLEITKPRELALLVKDLQEIGLAGLEVFYPDHTKEMVVQYQDIAKNLGLVCTGGSDFHGNLRDHSYLGNGILGQNLDYGILQNIRERLQERDNRQIQR